MLAFDLDLLDNLLAIDADLVVIATRRSGENKILAGLGGFERCGITNAPRGFVFRTPPLFFVVRDVRRAGSLGVAAEVLAGIGSLLHGAFPVRVPEDIVHLRQATRVEHADVGSNQIRDTGDDADGIERSGFRGTSATGNGRPSVGTDDGDG